jgi:hypothetical protein
VESDNGARAARGTHTGISEFVDIQRFVAPFDQFKGDATTDNTRTDNDRVILVFHQTSPFEDKYV